MSILYKTSYNWWPGTPTQVKTSLTAALLFIKMVFWHFLLFWPFLLASVVTKYKLDHTFSQECQAHVEASSGSELTLSLKWGWTCYSRLFSCPFLVTQCKVGFTFSGQTCLAHVEAGCGSSITLSSKWYFWTFSDCSTFSCPFFLIKYKVGHTFRCFTRVGSSLTRKQ